jgi:hypothetical protein
MLRWLCQPIVLKAVSESRRQLRPHLAQRGEDARQRNNVLVLWLRPLINKGARRENVGPIWPHLGGFAAPWAISDQRTHRVLTPNSGHMSDGSVG